jgi:ABC-type multidrug transport system fused ATPase/permease subunit
MPDKSGLNLNRSADIIRSVKPESRLLLIGIVVAALGLLISPLIMLGQAVGIKFSDIQLHLLFWVTIVAVAIGLLIILIAAGAFRWLRRFQWPIRLRSLRRVVPDHTHHLATFHLATKEELLQEQVDELETELHQFGDDPAARRLLKVALDNLPHVSVSFAKDFGGLLYAAHTKPRTNFSVDLSSIVHKDGTDWGTVSIPAINGVLTLPYGEAKSYATLMRQLIEQVQNDSINESKRLQQP